MEKKSTKKWILFWKIEVDFWIVRAYNSSMTIRKGHMINENITPEMVPDIHNKATTVAKTAVADWLADWNAKTGGNEYGEPMYCGFAWVELPSMKLSTKLGKAFAAVGFKKSYRRGLTLWNPGDHHGQSMDCKEIGADAYANVLESYGIQAYGASRAD